MEIREIRVHRVEQPVPSRYRLSGGRSFPHLDSTVVAVESDTGLVGWGEACPFGLGYLPAHALGVRAGIAEIAPHLIGADPLALERIDDIMDGVFPGLLHTKSALDIACWDLLGKATGLPVFQLLGGQAPLRLRLVSSVSIGTPDEMVGTVDAFRARGYTAHSVKVGGNDAEADRARIQAVLGDRRPGEEFIVDVNRGWTLDTALRVLSGLPSLDFTLEQPCATLAECRTLRQRTAVPISLDELIDTPAALLQAITEGAGDFLNIKICKQGGLTRSRQLRDLCRAAGFGVSIQETGGADIAFAALCHLAASTSGPILRHVWDPRELASIPTASGAPEVADGHATLAERPGLGIEPNLDAIGEPVAVYR